MYSLSKLRKSIDAWVRYGYSETEIVQALLADDKDDYHRLKPSEEEELRADVAKYLKIHENYPVVQELMKSKIIRLQDVQEDKIIAYNPNTETLAHFKSADYARIMEPSVLYSQTLLAHSHYDPRSKHRITKPSITLSLFNRYTPPKWLYKNFYFAEEIEPLSPNKLPELYDKFLKHLNDNDEASINYLLNWLAHSLKGKNQTALTAIGEQGIGKGLLGSIMVELHGKEEGNGTDVDGTKIGGQFQGNIAYRTFVHFDEVTISSQEEVNRFKQLINSDVEIEMKNKEAKTYQNYANLFLSANNMDNIKVPPNDRRFSFLNLTKTKMAKLDWGMTMEQLRNELIHPKNIEQLAKYLWHFKVDQNLIKEPFYSVTLEHMRKSALLQWERDFLQSYCQEFAGRDMLVQDIVDKLIADCGAGAKPRISVSSFPSLNNKLKPLLEGTGKMFFTPHRPRTESGGRPNMIKIAPLSEQPGDEFLDNYQNITENE